MKEFDIFEGSVFVDGLTVDDDPSELGLDEEDIALRNVLLPLQIGERIQHGEYTYVRVK